MKKIELLAPVGSMESLYAAVQNGAQAVYLGGKLFNARHYASNFDDDEMRKAVKYAHLRGVYVYVTVNILLEDGEIERALDYIKFLYDIGIDGIIVQDIGLASLVKKIIPEMSIHGSTQMTVNNLEGAKFLYEKGFSRVVLAREVPIKEIEYISKNTPIELEVFIHGALCVSYSGQCLMSSMIGGRSGNRGMCAQPCRMPSSIVNKKGAVLDNWENKHILSPKDLNTLEELTKLIEAGVLSLKIEGRMKRPEYVATVVNLYRKAIDLGYEKVTKKDKENIKQVFNRGFTKGLTFGDFGSDFINYDRPDNRGIELGEVIEVKKNHVKILLNTNIEVGDKIELVAGRDKYISYQATKDGNRGEEYIIDKTGYIEAFSKAYKKSSKNLLEKAKKSYEEENIKRDIELNLDIRLGDYPKLKVKSKDINFLVTGKSKIEDSKKISLTKEKVLEQISKLGDTVYRLKEININLDDGCFMPLSSLNQLRREATEKLDELILNEYIKSRVSEEKYKTKKKAYIKLDKGNKEDNRILTVKIENYSQYKSLNLDKLDRIIISYYDKKEQLLSTIEDLKSRDKGIEIYLGTEKILYREDINLLKTVLDDIKEDLTGVSVSNLGTLALVRDRYDLKIHGDIGLNIFNSYSVKFLEENGVTSLDLSPELTLSQIKAIVDNSNIGLSSIVYGYIPVMVTKHCPMSLVKGCKTDDECMKCEYSNGYSIRDRMNAEFRMVRKSGFTNIYNSVPVMVLDSLDKVVESGLKSVRIDFTIEEDKETINKLLEVYYDYLNGKINREEALDYTNLFRNKQSITRGHFFRGIIN